jgi:hypothetical protein
MTVQLRKVMAVNVCRLLEQHGRGRKQQEIAAEAWPDKTPSAARKALQRIKSGSTWPSDDVLESLARALDPTLSACAFFDAPK